MHKKNKKVKIKIKNDDDTNGINNEIDQSSDQSLSSVENPTEISVQSGANSEEHESVQETRQEVKKNKRVLRFQLPETTASNELFSSASSIDLQESFTNQTHEFNVKSFKHHHPRNVVPPYIIKSDVDTEEWNIYDPIFLGSSPNPSNEDINLINAAYLRKLEAAKEAVNNGADVNTFRSRQTPLLIATSLGDQCLVRYLLSLPKINPNFKNVHGETPLLIAIRNSSSEIVQMLLNHNADVNITDNTGRTPLHAALALQNSHLLKILLAFGANYERADIFGERPIYTAAIKKPNLECLNILLRVGASPDYYHICGNTLLSRAILQLTHFKVIEELVHFGASVNSVDLHSGRSPLHITAMINDIKIAKFLLSKGANANLKTFYNFTPYEEAIFHRSLDVAEFLFEKTKNASLKALTLLQVLKKRN